MYVNFPPDVATTRIDDDRIRDLTADEDNPEGHAIARDSPSEDSALQVTRELGEYLIDRYGFEEHSTTDDEDNA